MTLALLDATARTGPERFVGTDRGIERHLRRSLGGVSVSSVTGMLPSASLGLDAEHDHLWLTRPTAPTLPDVTSRTLRVADLFCGCGGLSIGINEAARAVGARVEHVLAVDTSQAALETFARNFAPLHAVSEPLESVFDGPLGGRLTAKELAWQRRVGRLDLLVGGPPCQGHSDLNNHTRRQDPRNDLYLRMARAVEVLLPEAVVIENVPGVRHDNTAVVAKTWEHLTRLGYHVSGCVLKASEFGVAQHRRRFFLVGARSRSVDLAGLTSLFGVPARSLRWAIGDLADRDAIGTYDSSAAHAPQNRRRIEYLFANGLYELPDSERPDCHRLKHHTYRSVYGRLSWDQPAPTITSGFGSTGQGRFVHPSQHRTLTPHEAARLQFIPDWFDFGFARRGQLQEMIGNAVPPKLAYVVALELLR